MSAAAVEFTPPTRGWAVRRGLQVLANGVRERVAEPVVATLGDVPRSGEEVTLDWLTAVMCRGVPGARVIAVESPRGSIGTTTRQALTLTYNEAGAGLPRDVYVKCTTALAQRLILGLGQFIAGEPAYYNLVRPQLDVEAPLGYHGDVDSRSWRSVVVMEDVVATKGAEFWSTEFSMTRERMEDLLANTAVWHGRFWASEQLDSFRWLKTPEQHLAGIDAVIGMEKRSHVGHDRARAVIPASIADRKADLYEGMRRSMAIQSGGPHTYLHGDYHVGNTYLTSHGRMGIGDWQIGVRGTWSYDFAYVVGSGLAVEDRRAWERDLLDFYLERLASSGGPRLDREAAMDAYRQATFYPYYAWAYTIGRSALMPKYQPDEISLAVIERTTAAIDDLESLKAVGL